MKIFLVRHCKAISRKDWENDAVLRPLTEVGQEQATAIARELAGEPITRIVSSPMLACQQSVEPLTLATGIPVEVDERIGDGEPVQRVLQLLPSRDDGAVVFCTHRDSILGLLRLFELCDAADTEIPCRKGSIRILEGSGQTPTTSRYCEPALHPANLDPRNAGSIAPESVRAGVVDLGSTSFKMLIADVDGHGGIRPVVQEKVMLLLGSALAVDGLIPDRTCKRSVEVARELRAVAEQEKVQRLLPVATSALRDAPNGADLAARIGRALGSDVRILSGEEEARLIFRAFQQRVRPTVKPVLGLDLGGGSFELALGSGERVDLEITLPLGVARLYSGIVESDPMRKSERKRIRKRVRELLAPHKDALLRRRPRQTIAAGGTIRALARLVLERRAEDAALARRHTTLRADVLAELADQLVAAPREERLAMRGIRTGRADLLPTGAVILTTLMAELELEELTVSDWGLREGVLLEMTAPATSPR